MTHPVSSSPSAYDVPATYERLDLERKLGTSVWLGRADGTSVAARLATAAVFDRDSPSREKALRRATDLAKLRSPCLVPLLGIVDRDGTTWLVSEYVEGVSLSRLLGAATLTPVQAGYVGLRLLQGLARLQEQGLSHGRLTATNVLVGVDGEPRLSDWSLASLARARALKKTVEQDLTNAAGLMAGLARNADRPVTRHQDGHRDLMDELEQLGRGDDPGTATDAAERLGRSLQATVGEATSMAGPRSELAALVGMLVRRRSPDQHAETPPPMAPIGVPSLLPSGRLSEADWHRMRRPWVRIGGAVLAAIVLLLGAYLGVRALVDQLSDGDKAPVAERPTVTGKPTPSSSPRSGSSSTPGAVPVLAPPRAGAITGVTVRPMASCSAGASCLLRATARVSPATRSAEVGLELSVVNRCTGRVRTSPAGTVTAQAGWSYVFVTTSVRLPRSGAVAVVATTTMPARAGSQPLLVPADGGSC